MTGFLFGKLPAHGDFVARGLDSEARRWWDERLAAGMARARDESGWEAAFDRAAPWRFRLERSEGVVSGAIAPSIDRAGRRFPLVAGVDGDGGAAGAEAALFAALAEGWDARRLHAELAACAGEPEQAPLANGWWLDGGELVGVAPLADPDPAAIVPAMLAAAAQIAAMKSAA